MERSCLESEIRFSIFIFSFSVFIFAKQWNNRCDAIRLRSFIFRWRALRPIVKSSQSRRNGSAAGMIGVRILSWACHSIFSGRTHRFAIFNYLLMRWHHLYYTTSRRFSLAACEFQRQTGSSACPSFSTRAWFFLSSLFSFNFIQ